MPHISNKKLNPENLDNLLLQLVKMIDTIGTESKSEVLFKEFFTETEATMFAKRLAIIFMLSEGMSGPYISDVLFVSPSTVDLAHLNYENGKYQYLIKIIKKNNKSIWGVIESFISNSVSAQVGKRRMAWMDKLEEKHNKKIFKY